MSIAYRAKLDELLNAITKEKHSLMYIYGYGDELDEAIQREGSTNFQYSGDLKTLGRLYAQADSVITTMRNLKLF